MQEARERQKKEVKVQESTEKKREDGRKRNASEKRKKKAETQCTKTTMCRTDTSHGGGDGGGSELMMDPACAAPEEGVESGEQPDERLKRLGMETESERLWSSQRGRGREMGKEKGRETDHTTQ